MERQRTGEPALARPADVERVVELASANGSTRFAGVIDPASFTLVKFAWTSWNDYVGFDRMRVDLSAAATPEPASTLLVLSAG